MNGYDAFLLGVVAVSIVMGLVKGLIRELFSLAGVVLGVVIALIGSPALARSLGNIIPSQGAAYAAAFLILFLATLFVSSLLGGLLNKLMDIAHLGLANRMLGGVFGLLRGVVTVMVITLGLTLFLEEDSHLLAESLLVPHIVFSTRALAPLLPAEIESVLNDRIDRLPAGDRPVGLIAPRSIGGALAASLPPPATPRPFRPL